MLKKIKHVEAWLGASIMLCTMDAMAAGGGDLSASAGTLTTGLEAVQKMLPVGSQILGFLTAGGGLLQIYKHHKSQGREGNMAAGIAGIVIGVCLFALGGFLKWTGTSIGVDASDVAMPGAH